MTTKGGRVHLIVLIHGLYGNPNNLAVVKEELERADRRNRGDEDEDEVEDLLDPSPTTTTRENSLELKILICKSFTGSHTWDGIDVNAHKAAGELDAEIERIERQGNVVEVFSIMGYSLGGLVARYLIGLLHARSPSFFVKHRAGTFNTFATPARSTAPCLLLKRTLADDQHIGTLRYGSRVNTVVHTVGKRLFSRSGRQLYRLDTEADGRSLLAILADPDHIFFQALRQFRRIKIVANGCNDLTVPYPTGSISLTDPFVDHITNHIDIELDQSNCVVEYSFPPAEPDHPELEKWIERRMRRLEELERERHRLPPFIVLPLPGPLKHITFLFIPLLLPIILTYAVITLVLHSWQSAKRLRQHLHYHHSNTSERTPLLSQPISTSSGASTTSRASISRSRSNKMTTQTTLMNNEYNNTPIPNKIPLLLDAEQVQMVHNLNTLPLERVTTFWPWCWNTHAMLVVRAAKRFKYQEQGRKVVRDWAEWVVDVGEGLAVGD